MLVECAGEEVVLWSEITYLFAVVPPMGVHIIRY